MDHYRILSAASDALQRERLERDIRDGRQPAELRVACASAKHVRGMLECASPPIDRRKDDLFVKVEQRGGRMFFSQRKLEAYFRGLDDKRLEEILKCECGPCQAHRGEPLNALIECIEKSKEKNAWILVPVMIYLGKFHFVYPFLRAIGADHITSKERIRQVECKDVVGFRNLFDSDMDMERNLFRDAYDRVWSMFNPVRFAINAQGWVVPQNLPDWARFPYQDEGKVSLPQGQSSTVTYAEIPDEYVEESVEQRMKAYPDAIISDGITKVFRIVRKAIELSDDQREGMQYEILSLLALHKAHKRTHNIITLLGLYRWRGKIHYVFPYVEQNLAVLLSKAFIRDPRDGISETALCLPDIWLWREMIGVAKALEFIHQGIPNPFSGDSGKVVAFHFDLKPENIMVKWDSNPEHRRLQITDFGRSQIRLLDEGEEISSSFHPGDYKYMAPEAEARSEKNGTSRGNEPRDITALQTYDVWSLACIMLEVLIYLRAEHAEQRSGPGALREFDEARSGEIYPSAVSFFTLGRTKDVVSDKVKRIQSWLGSPNIRDDPHNDYINKLECLLSKMFAFDKTDRATSEEVVTALQEADDQFSRSRSETDALHSRIRRAFQHKQYEFREVGWYNENTLVSFLKMEDIRVQVSIILNDGSVHETYDDQNCRFQLLYKEEGPDHAGKFLMKWGLQHNQNEPPRMLQIMDATRTQIVPRHLYQPRASSEYHNCMLLSETEYPPHHRWQATIGFRKKEEAQAFQGALLHFRILPGSAMMYVPDVTWTVKSHKEKKEKKSQAKVPFWKKDKTASDQQASSDKKEFSDGNKAFSDKHLHFEFWERNGPNYYDPRMSHQPSSPPVSRSPGGYTILAIFRKGKPLLLLPLNINDKRFQHTGRTIIGADYNQSQSFRNFVLLSVNEQCRLCQGRNQQPCRCDRSPWDDRAIFSDLDEPAIPLELTLLNLSHSDSHDSLTRSRLPDRLVEISKVHELLFARFFMLAENAQQDVACFRQAIDGIYWNW